jgi:hypothetical protein
VKSSRAPSVSALSAYGLLAAGLSALVAVSVPGGSVLQRASPAALVTGTNPIDVTSLAVGGGLLAVGVAAIALGLSLFFARVA